MDVLFSPFVRLWTWIERTGGFPGQVFFCVTLVMLVVGLCTWLANKK
jgi:hypothetical protein